MPRCRPACRLHPPLLVALVSASSLSAQLWNGAGADNNFSTAANWNGAVAPTNDGTAAATLGGSTRTTPVLDQDYALDTLYIRSGGFTLDGTSTLTLGSGLLKSNTTYTSFTANVPLALTGDLAIGGAGTAGSILLNGAISGDHGLNFSGSSSASLFLAGDNTFTGPIQVDTGGVYIGRIGYPAAGSLASSVNVALLNSGRFAFNRSGNVTFDGVISGSGSSYNAFSVSGGVGANALTVELTNQNTYTGGTTVTGTLVIGTTNALPTATALSMSSNGTLDVNFDQTVGNLSGGTGTLIDVAASKTFTSQLSANSTTGGTTGSGSVVISGAYNLQTYDEWEHTGGTTLEGTNLIIGAGYGYGGLVGDVTNNGTVTFNKSTSITYADAMTGTGGITKKGNNTLILTGANQLSGMSVVESGTLRIGNYGTSGSLTSDLSINSGAIVDFTHTTDTTYSGQIAGSGYVLKNGSGTLTLSGGGSFSGTFAPSANTTLQVNGAFAAADVQVAGSLLGTGTLHDVTVTSGGNLSAGGILSSGSITLNHLKLAAGSHLIVDILNAGGSGGSANGWDVITVGGGLDLSAASSAYPIQILLGSLAGPGTSGAALNFNDSTNYSWSLISGASNVIAFSADSFAISTTSFQNDFSGAFSVSQIGNNIVLNYQSLSAVPEPATYAALCGLVVLTLTATRTRRRRRA